MVILILPDILPDDLQPMASFPDAVYYASSAFLTLGLEGAHATGIARGLFLSSQASQS